MQPNNGSDLPSRVRRLEELAEVLINRHLDFEDEHKRLLTAQVVLTDRMSELAAAQIRAEKRMDHLDEKMNALIAVVDGIVRGKPPSEQ